MCDKDVNFITNEEREVDVDDGVKEMMDIEMVLLDNEISSQSAHVIGEDDFSEKKSREAAENVNEENCVASTSMEDESLLPDKEQLQCSEPRQELQLISMDNNNGVRIDCSNHFKTDEVFRTKEEILHWAKLQGRQSGCVLTVKKAQEAKHGRAPRLYLSCERGGKYKYHGSSSRKGIRKSGTKKCACPFELGTTWSLDGEKEWKAKVFVRNGIHNHQLVKFAEGHTHAGRLTKKELGIVANMAKAGTRPKDILCTLRTNDPENCTSLQQIYNAIYAMKTKGKYGKSATQNLPEELTDSRETACSQNEVLNEIEHVSDASMLEPSDAVETTGELFRSNSDVISLPERVRRLEKFVGLGGSAEKSIEVVSDAISLPERVERLEYIVGIADSAEVSQSFPRGRGDVENCVLDTPKGRGDVENCVLDTPMEDGSVDCSSQFKTDKEFRTKEEVLHWAKLQGRKTGALIMMSKSQAPHGGRAPRLYLKCDRGGKYERRADPQRLRKSGTKKCACPFELGTTWSRVGDEEWKIKVYVRNGFHNHPLEKFNKGCNPTGKLTKEELNIIAVLAKAGVKPSEIMKALRKNDPGNCTSLKQLYNAILALKSKGKLRAVESSTE